MEIAKLLRAGFPLEKALATLNKQTLPPPQQAFVDVVARELKAGSTIAQAVAQSDLELSEIEKSLIDAGETGGRLDEVFNHLGSYFRRIDLAFKTVITHLFYPLALFHIAVFLPILPKLIVESTWQVWRPPIFALMTCYGTTALIIAGYHHCRKHAATSPRTDLVLNSIPLIGELRQSLAAERYCRVFRIHLITGFRPSEAILAAARASQSGLLIESSDRISFLTAQGLALGPQFQNDPAYPEAFSKSIAVAEEAGTLDEELQRWARHFSLQADECFDKIQNWLPRIVYGIAITYATWQILRQGVAHFSIINDLLKDL